MSRNPFLKNVNTPFVRRLSVLAGGSVLGQVIYLSFSPFIARIYSPADFSVFGIFGSLSAMLAVVGALRFDMAIPGCRNDHEAAAVFVVALLSALCVFLALEALLIPFGPWIVRLIDGDSLDPYLWLLPITVLGFSLNAIFMSWAVRKQHIRSLAHGKVIQGLGLSLGQACLGWCGVRPAGLIFGQVAGQLIGVLPLIPGSPCSRILTLCRGGVLTAVFRRYSAFPRISVAASLIEAIFGNIPLLYVAAHFGAQAAGLMTLVQRMIVAPMNLVSANIGQVYNSELAAAKPLGAVAMQAVFASHLKQTVVLGIVGFGFAAILAPAAVPIVFGDAWKDTVIVYWIMLPMSVMGFIAGPFGSTLDVLFKQKAHLMRAAIRAVLVLGVLGLVNRLELGWLGGLGVISLGVTLVYASYLLASYHAILGYQESVSWT